MFKIPFFEINNTLLKVRRFLTLKNQSKPYYGTILPKVQDSYKKMNILSSIIFFRRRLE